MVKIPLRPSSLEDSPSLSPENQYRLPDSERGMSIPQRVLIASLCVGVGLTLSAVGFGSISYRLMHMTVEGGLVNGRLVRLRSPINGEIKDFFARPGVSVQAGQVLARLRPSISQSNNLVQLQTDLATKMAQRTAAQQAIALLQQQLADLGRQQQLWQTMNLRLANAGIAEQQAAVQGAIATAQAAQTEYQRYQNLEREGVVSKQLVDRKRADWESAQAVVDRMRATLQSAQVSSEAVRQGVVLSNSGDLQGEMMRISRQVQEQSSQVTRLTAQITSAQQQLQTVQKSLNRQKDVEITAPFTGVIYNTERDAGEQTNRPEVLMSLLDCNTLWVETLLSAEQANRIDDQKPVRIQMDGKSTTLTGEIKLIEALSPAELARKQAQALIPAVPANLSGVPLSRVVVQMPAVAQQQSAHQFCGVGQTAQVTFGMRSVW